MSNYEGSVPYKGKLKISRDTPDNEFIGYLRVLAEIGENAYEDMGQDFMYFKDYDIESIAVEPKKVVKFKNHEFNEKDVFYFDMSFMRIPPDLVYVGIDDRGGSIELFESTLTKTNMYFGLSLLNIHKVGCSDSIASRTYLEPNRHYFTGIKSEKSKDSPAFTGGKFGCKKAASFGENKMPIFSWPPDGDPYPYDRRLKKTLLLMHFGTDNHIGFCEVEDTEIGKAKIVKAITTARTSPPPPPPGGGKPKKLGYELKYPEQYITDGFEFEYGVHIVDNKATGWHLDYWKSYKYGEKPPSDEKH